MLFNIWFHLNRFMSLGKEVAIRVGVGGWELHNCRFLRWQVLFFKTISLESNNQWTRLISSLPGNMGRSKAIIVVSFLALDAYFFVAANCNLDMGMLNYKISNGQHNTLRGVEVVQIDCKTYKGTVKRKTVDQGKVCGSKKEESWEG